MDEETGGNVPLVNPETGDYWNPYAVNPGSTDAPMFTPYSLGLDDFNRFADAAKRIPGVDSALSAAKWLDARTRAMNKLVSRYFTGMSKADRLKLATTLVSIGCVAGGAVSAGAMWGACVIAATGLSAAIAAGQAAQQPSVPRGLGSGAAAVSHYCAIANAAGVVGMFTRMVCATAMAVGIGSGAAGASGNGGKRK